MQVETVAGGDCRDAGNVVGATYAGAADAGDDAGWQQPGRLVRDDCRLKCGEVHAVQWAARSDAHEILLADARHPDGAVDRGMDLTGAIDAHWRLAGQAVAVALPTERALAHHQDRGKRGGRSRILDNAGKTAGKAERLAHPVDHARLKLGGGRRRLPQHALCGHGRDEVFRDHRYQRRIGGEIGEEARMLPMRHAGHDLLLEIGEDLLHRLGRFRRRRGDLCKNIAGLRLRPHRPLAQRLAIGDAPFGSLCGPVAEFVGVHEGSLARLCLMMQSLAEISAQGVSEKSAQRSFRFGNAIKQQLRAAGRLRAPPHNWRARLSGLKESPDKNSSKTPDGVERSKVPLSVGRSSTPNGKPGGRVIPSPPAQSVLVGY